MPTRRPRKRWRNTAGSSMSRFQSTPTPSSRTLPSGKTITRRATGSDGSQRVGEARSSRSPRTRMEMPRRALTLKVFLRCSLRPTSSTLRLIRGAITCLAWGIRRIERLGFHRVPGVKDPIHLEIWPTQPVLGLGIEHTSGSKLHG